MNKYILEMQDQDGNLAFDFDEKGRIKKFECNMLLNTEQLTFLNRNFPVLEKFLPNMVTSKGRLTRINNLTFDYFWEKWDYKQNKIQAERAWNNTTKENKLKAVMNIAPYKYYVRVSGVAHLQAATYLNQQRYLDDYKSLIEKISNKR
jgi:hypothetical protein